MAAVRKGEEKKMTDEKLEFANDLKARINKLDDEIHKIMDLCPPIRSHNPRGGRGIFRKIKSRCLICKGSYEIELSNEDCRALVDIRTAEQEALKQVLSNLN